VATDRLVVAQSDPSSRLLITTMNDYAIRVAACRLITTPHRISERSPREAVSVLPSSRPRQDHARRNVEENITQLSTGLAQSWNAAQRN
jgi:hypothetical protein